MLREWRRRARMTQLDFAAEANISQKHLCFLETGRAQPSREMLLRLTERLQVSLRERNLLLNAAGFAPQFPQRNLDDQALGVVRNAIDVLLKAHEPYPAFAVDRHWTLVASNRGFRPFLGNMDPKLLQPPINVLRLTLSPGGLGPRLANFYQWRSHVLDKLRSQSLSSGDPKLNDLLNELRDYPGPAESSANPELFPHEPWHDLVVPFQLLASGEILSFYSTTTVFGTPRDVTLSELSLEFFYPADASTAEMLRSTAQAADI